MAIKVETGTWTGNNSTPQTITLADSGLTPVAIIVWIVRQGAAAAGFVANQVLSIGFGTRQGGSTQSGCVGMWSSDAVGTTSSGRVRNSTLLHVLSSETGLDYTVSLSSFAAGQFVVTYSSAAAANGDVFHYMVIGGASDAVVLNKVLSSTGATEAETGAGFLPTCMLCLDADLASDNAPASNLALSFGCATGPSNFWSVAITQTDGDTMTSSMNWNKAFRSDACLERLSINSDNSDARWDLNSFDSDGFTLGVVDTPASTDRTATFLLLAGVTAEAGVKNKASATGNDTFTLANGALSVVGVLMGMTRSAAGVTAGDATMVIGAGSTANTTRGSAVNHCVGVTGPETINTTADRFSATDSVIEELTGGTSPAETSEAWFDTKSLGSFVIDWAVNGGSTNPVGYLALGDTVITGSGSAAMSPFAASSSGAEKFTGSGSAAVQSFATSSSGVEKFIGTGSAAVQSFAADGSGSVVEGGGSITGSGSAAVQSFAADGSGAEKFIGSGSAAVQNFAASSSGTQKFIASGSAAVQSFAASSAGVEKFNGTSSVAVQSFAATSSGHMANNIGSGSAAVQSFAASSSGVEKFIGSGSAAVQSFAASSSGGEKFIGTGSAAVQSFAATALGATASNVGSGSAAVQSFAATSSGAEKFVGSGSAAMQSFAATSSGAEKFVGSGSAAVQSFAATSSGTEKFVGSGSAAVQSFAATSSGTEKFVGSGSAAIQSFACSATAAERFSGVCSAAVQSFACSGVGIVLLPVIGSAAVQSFACSGAGDVGTAPSLGVIRARLVAEQTETRLITTVTETKIGPKII